MAIQQYGLLEPTTKQSIVLIGRFSEETRSIDAWWAPGRNVYLVQLKTGIEGFVRFVPGSGKVGDMAPFGGTFYATVAQPLSMDVLLRVLGELSSEVK